MQGKENTTSKNLIGILKKVWRFFSSIKLALVLILLICGFSLIGTLVTRISVFHSWWFFAAGTLLMINIIVCSLNRWGNLKLSLQGGAVKQEESFYSSGNYHTNVSTVYSPSSETSHIPENILRKRGYRVRTENRDGNIYIAADKHRHFRLGTYASHLSLVLFVLAFLLGSYFGFRDKNFVVAEGNTKLIGHNTNLSIQLVSFVDEYYADNMPKDYRSQVILYENGQEVRQTVVRVNHPLTYKGISVYQMFFGPAIQLQIAENGNVLYQGNVPLDNLINNQGLERYVGSVVLPGGINVQVISSAINVTDPVIPQGQLAIYMQQNGNQIAADSVQKCVPRDINGMEFSYQADSKYSGFQISRDPGSNLIWVAAILFILGTMSVLYFPYRQVWILYQTQSPDSNRLLIRLGVSKGFNGASELKILAVEMGKGLQTKG